MKATALLEKQHRKVKAIFKKLESGRADPGPLVQELSDELAAHMAIEQEIFYPAVREKAEDLVLESYEEHSVAELSLKRLLATDSEDEAFHARVTVLKELIEHHVEEEEEELFPKVERALGEAKLLELGTQMKTRFQEVLKEGFDRAVPKGFNRTSADASKRLSKKILKARAA